MTFYILILFFLSYIFFIFYHFKYGAPEELGKLRNITKYLFLSSFWIFYLYNVFNIQYFNSYSNTNGTKEQLLIIDNHLEINKLSNFLIAYQSSVLDYESEPIEYKWNLFYSNKFLILPQVISSSKNKDTVQLRYNSTKFSRFLVFEIKDSIIYSTNALQYSKKPIIVFSSDFSNNKFQFDSIDLSNEINMFIMFFVAIFGSFYHIINLKFKFRIVIISLFSLIIIWSGFNLYHLFNMLLPIVSNWHDVGIFNFVSSLF